MLNMGIPTQTQIIRQTRKYFRYQSGKGLLWSTGTLLKPNYDIRAISQSGTSVGSNIFVTTDDILHGLQVGAQVRIEGFTASPEFDGLYQVTGINSDTQFQIQAQVATSAAVGVKASLIQETRSRQQEFNIDRVDGTGPSGFTINTARMHMLGIQYTWYGAGFVDWMVRGSDGNWVYVHRLKNNNVNYESHMRTGNLPVRYSIENEGAISWLTSGTSASDTSMWVADNTYFATTGTVYIDNELINYTGKSGSSILTGLTRAVPLTQWINGANYTMTAGAAAIHSIQTGVIQISNYATPTLSHWGSALLVDGLFDEDRGYIFNYQQSNLSITIATATVFLIRLAPSVSNSAVGDLGTRDLINRSTMLLSECAVSLAQGNNNPQSIIVEGVLNPKNVSGASWSSLNLETQGGQPSLGQVANSGQ
ncbi:hypothetical protein EB118_24455, partial [bacterium]|nr:hypothetical protein [bacterium]